MARETVAWKKGTCITIACLVFALSILPACAQEGDGRYFEETGFSVAGIFLDFYDQHGGLPSFGYPLTEQFEENGLQVQYFQRVRMEAHPDGPGPHKVQLGLLGEELAFAEPPIPEQEIPRDHPDKEYFPQTGHTVTFAFLTFFHQNGGPEILGYPISEWVFETNGRLVQYFQRAKMEWFPENQPGQRVQLGMLGTIYVEQHVDPIHRQRQPDSGIREQVPTPTPTPNPAPADVEALFVSATLQFAIVDLDDIQIVYVYVRDQEGRGVSGASVEIEVNYGGGRTESFTLAATNADGHAQLEFPVGEAAPGQMVVVSVSAHYGTMSATTSAAFLRWL